MLFSLCFLRLNFTLYYSLYVCPFWWTQRGRTLSVVDCVFALLFIVYILLYLDVMFLYMPSIPLFLFLFLYLFLSRCLYILQVLCLHTNPYTLSSSNRGSLLDLFLMYLMNPINESFYKRRLKTYMCISVCVCACVFSLWFVCKFLFPSCLIFIHLKENWFKIV